MIVISEQVEIARKKERMKVLEEVEKKITGPVFNNVYVKLDNLRFVLIKLKQEINQPSGITG